ncbi:iron complex transport system substrate-binding protein [Parapedobacter composti]|uniref:Iron complex transport system substrate-binding protein n=1 Tax=Parapedobacter composti TaxID=623281 RepID=A0A1I1I680_9SPHI|nr:ABC transporter substrate-binding protein [Parapedobacter composti]SFC31312.1 iron complex transport system substrate-binding protein [Parapedobacter composti]
MRSHFSAAQLVLDALNLAATDLPLLEHTGEYQDLVRATTPDDVYTGLRAIGRILNAQQRAETLVEALEERINIIVHKLKFIPETHKPRVLLLQAISPLTAIRQAYLDNLVRIAGGIPLLETAAAGEQPDIIILISKEPVPQLLKEVPGLFSAPAWRHVPAIMHSNIFIIHHNQYLRQPGALIADDAEILAEIIHPKYFIFGRDEDVWMRFNLS